MSAEHLCLFLDFKRGVHGEPLLDHNDLPIMDVEGNPVFCDGGWNAPTIAEHLQAAVRNLHKARGHTGSYTEACPNCVEKIENSEDHMGCHMHYGIPRLSRTGNPTLSVEFKNAIKKWAKAGANYEVRGCAHMLPSQVRMLHNFLVLGNGTLKGLQTYVCMLLGIKCFLRYEEFSSMKIDSFCEKMSIVDASGLVQALVIRICGKSDVRDVYMYIWADHQHPEFCPVRHLMVYLYLTGIKSGFLFPPEHHLKNPPEDGFFPQSVKYQTVLARICHAFETKITAEERGNVRLTFIFIYVYIYHKFSRNIYIICSF